VNDQTRRARYAPSARKASADPDEWESFPSEVDPPAIVDVDGDLGLDSFAEETSLSDGTPARTAGREPASDSALDPPAAPSNGRQRLLAALRARKTAIPIPFERLVAVAVVAVALLGGLGYLLLSDPGSMVTSTAIPAENGPFIATSPPPIAQAPPAVSMTAPASPPAPRLSEPGANLSRGNVQRVPTIEAKSVAVAPSLPSPPAPIAPSTVVEPVSPEPPPTVARTDTPDPVLDRVPLKESGLERDEGEIRSLLEAYRQSYLRLDVVSTAKLWPGVDTAALARAFGTIASQQLDFEQCAFDVSGQRAKAHCQGSLHYVRRVGNATRQSREMSWAFELDRSSGRWLIDRVTTQ
jgi:hypothetical protein